MELRRKLILLIVIVSFIGLFLDMSEPSIRHGDFMESLKYFRYFTVQSNLIVFLYFLILLFNKKPKNSNFQHFFGAVLIYITITMSVFIIFIQPVYSPEGFRIYGSIFAHYITPTLVIMYFINERKEYDFNFKDIIVWIIYPVFYLIYIVLHGIKTGDYLYPFFQVELVGVSGLIISITAISVLFLIMSFLLVKIVSKRENV